MDAEGFLPITLIASFPRVRSLTQDLALICEGLRDSDKVELSDDGNMVRPRLNPTEWPLTPTVHAAQPTTSQSEAPSSVASTAESTGQSASQTKTEREQPPPQQQQSKQGAEATEPSKGEAHAPSASSQPPPPPTVEKNLNHSRRYQSLRLLRRKRAGRR